MNAMQLTDDALMQAFARGEAKAFDALYARYQPTLYNYLLRSCGSPTTAADLAQETWLSLTRNRDGYRPSERFAAYLFHIAHNKLIDHWRSAPNGVGSLDEELNEPEAGRIWQPDVVAEAQDQLSRFITVLQHLPVVQREAFLLQQDGGLSLEEIASLTGVGRETVKSRLRYAMSKLREVIIHE